MHKPCNTERTVQAQMAGGGCIICDLLFAEAFGVAGWLSRQLSRNCQLEWQCHALHMDICALTYLHKASELTAGKVLLFCVFFQTAG